MFGKQSKILVALLAVGLELAAASQEQSFVPDARTSAGVQSRLLERCCQVGRERALESQKFNCKLAAREALLGGLSAGRSGKLLAQAVDGLLGREPNFADQCELVLESCCLAHHRTRNCDSGKQFAKSGAACMDVELSKEATVATESFNDCCMACSLGILAARQVNGSHAQLADRCRLLSPLAASLSGQLYEQTYVECCQENLPRLSSALLEPGAPVDCAQANSCSQRCLSAGSLDSSSGQRVEQDRCGCFSGFRLAPDGTSCLDVDECRLNLHTCNKSELCDNTRGSFKCLARSQSAGSSSSSSHHQYHHQSYSQSQHQVNHRPASQLGARSLSLEEAPGSGEQPSSEPFASMRLCPPGLHWLNAENRCQSEGEQRALGPFSRRSYSRLD